MKTQKLHSITYRPALSKPTHYLLGALAAAPLVTTTVWADDAPPPSKVHALVDFQFANE